MIITKIMNQHPKKYNCRICKRIFHRDELTNYGICFRCEQLRLDKILW